MGFSSLPECVQKFIDDTQEIARERGVTIRFSEESKLTHPVSIVNESYFRISPIVEIAVATGGRQMTDWLRLFVRESCHMDQYFEQTPEWVASREGDSEVIDILDLWIQHKVELSPEQIEDYITRGRALELECEKRTLAKIAKYDLPIMKLVTIQKANAYLFFYRIVAETRQWYSEGEEPHLIAKIWRKMPPNFVEDYDTVFAKKEFLQSLKLIAEEVENEIDTNSNPDLGEWKQSAGYY